MLSLRNPKGFLKWRITLSLILPTKCEVYLQVNPTLFDYFSAHSTITGLTEHYPGGHVN